MTPKRSASAAALAAMFAIASVADVSAKPKSRHHHRQAGHAAATPYGQGPHVEIHKPFSFYPENIEGGVPGNLPFNNQLRKFSDPLNANGGGGA